MKSPIAPHTPLTRKELLPQLFVYECGISDGIYIPAHSYWSWLQKQPERLPQLPHSSESYIPSAEPTDAKLCPESGLMMQRYRVGNDFSFTIDRSPTGGIWLDQGEWNALQERQFHDELHLIFTHPWQNKARRDELEQASEERLRHDLGDTLFQAITDLKAQLAHTPHKEKALAYLISR